MFTKLMWPNTNMLSKLMWPNTNKHLKYKFIIQNAPKTPTYVSTNAFSHKSLFFQQLEIQNMNPDVNIFLNESNPKHSRPLEPVRQLGPSRSTHTISNYDDYAHVV